MVIAEFSIFPLDKGQSVGQYVARALDIIDRSGLSYRLGPMGTCVEGEWKEVSELIHRCYKALARDCQRIICTVKYDYRKGHADRLVSKTKKIQKLVGRKLKM